MGGPGQKGSHLSGHDRANDAAMSDMNNRTLLMGAGWLCASKLITQVLSFVANLYIANMIGPTGYALVGLGLAVIYLVDNLAEFGMGVAIISKRNITEAEISASFYINMVLALVLVAGCYASSGLMERFFDKAGLGSVLNVLALGVALRAAGIVPYKLLEKQLRFREKSLIDIISKASSSCVALGLAYLGYGIWAIVFGQIVQSGAAVGLSFFFRPYVPRIRFRLAETRELLAFSLNVFVLKITWYFKNQSDQLVGGKLLSGAEFGIYSLGFQLARNIQDILHAVISTLSLPALSSVEHDKQAFRTLVVTLLRYSSMLALPVFIGGALCADQIIAAFMTDKWLPASETFRFACIVQIFRTAASSYENIFIALNRTGFTITLNAATIVAQVAGFIVGSQFGAFGLSLSWAALSAIAFFSWSGIVSRTIEIPILQMLKPLAAPLAATLLMAATVLAVMVFTRNGAALGTGPALTLASYVLVGACAYALASACLISEVRAVVLRKATGERK